MAAESRQTPPLGGSRPTLTIGGRQVVLSPGVRVQGELPRVDIVIVFDTTGSMSDKRTVLTACMSEFVDSLDAHRLDWRVSVLPFGDLQIPGDRIDAHLPFVATAGAARSQLAAMQAFTGGGNGGESSIEAMEAALDKPWRERALKIIVLLTDDRAHGAERASRVRERLVASDTLCFAATFDTSYYRQWATRTGGTWSLISADWHTAALHDVFRRLVRDVALTASKAHQQALGSPQRYRALTK